MINGLNVIYKLHIYVGLAGFFGCVLSFIISDFQSQKSRFSLESVSTFLLGNSFAGVLFVKLFPDYVFLNIFISFFIGLISSFVAREFCRVSLKKTCINEFEV